MKKANFISASASVLSALLIAGCCAPDKMANGVRTEALDNSAWDQSVWISAANATVHDLPVCGGGVNERSADGSSWFVSTVKNEKKVTSAKWMTSGLGVYDIFVNGTRIGEEILKPGFTHYAKTKRSFTYDITDVINTKAGAENVLSAQLTPGWWSDRIMTPGGRKGMLGDKCAFRAVLELTYSDGSKKLYGTDLDNWLAGVAGPVKHAAIYDGEEYDAREEPGYATLSKLSRPEVNNEFNGEIVPSNGAEVYLRKDLALKPIKAYVWKDIEGATENAYGKVVVLKDYAAGEEMMLKPGETLVVDFGQNCAGVPSFVFKSKCGTTLTCLPSEILNDGNGARSRGMDGPEGSCHRANLRTQDYHFRMLYTFGKDEDFVSYTPRCSYFGYRAVSITATDEVVIKSIESIPVTSIAKNLETGVITTGNELINKLISNTIWGQRSNYLSVPTDCPQRNERLGWTADTQVFTETGTFFANTDRFFHKWLRDVRDAQDSAGGYPSVAPETFNAGMMRVGWADAGIIVPWTIWKQFGDTAVIEESWESMERFMNLVGKTKYDHTALAAENGNDQYADWLSYESIEANSGRTSDECQAETITFWNFLCASYWAIDATMMRDMAEAAGKDVAKYETMTTAAKEYIKATFLNSDGTFKTPVLNTMQTPALFVLKNGLFEGKSKDNIVARLRQNFTDHDGCLQTGFLGTSILMDVLTENGMVDVAYDLLFQRKNPSWLYSVDNGATTIWERWNSYTIENGMGPAGMNSFNHYAYGAVCAWIWKTAAGIASDTADPGFKHIIMKPVPDKRLGSINAEYNSASGLIKSSWKYEGDKWIWNFTVPEGSTATVSLPGETESKDYAAGSYTIEK